MKKVFLILLIILTLLVFQKSVCAEAPVASTEFYEAYLDVEMVQRARILNVLGLEIAEYLSSPDNPIDEKAAVINALSWKFEGTNNTEFYMYYLALLYHVPLIELDTDFLSADETFCLGYLMVMDNFHHPEGALPILEEARKKLEDSFTVSIIFALARSQLLLRLDWCEVWKSVEKVLESKDLKQDMRPEAKKRIIDYMIAYKEYCK
ncbi:MAG: hypothetical protein MRJ65_10795 [Candidatus Brocadiaceae bacterium]|nr:hypothetical protein [Candidatus Brocadiaceae bacterium]